MTYVIHDVSPSLERDALEHGQHRQSEVVEVCDAKVGTLPVEVTHLVSQTPVTLTARLRRLLRHLLCTRTPTLTAVTVIIDLLLILLLLRSIILDG